MKVQTIDVYENEKLKRPENPAGILRCFIPETALGHETGRVFPAVLILPGGAYAWISPREAEPVALRFVSRGWAAFVLDYTCAPSRFPVALREAAAAMLTIRRNAADFHIDPHKVAAIGFSAGGHLCGTLGTLYDCPEVSDLGAPEEIRPDALGLCYPVAVSWGRTHEDSFRNITGGDPALRERLSLERLVRPDMPPTFLWHTRDDQAVPSRNSLLVAVALEEAGVPFAMHIYAHGSHGLSTADALAYPTDEVPEISWDVPGWAGAMERFFADQGLGIRDLGVER